MTISHPIFPLDDLDSFEVFCKMHLYWDVSGVSFS